MRNAWAVKVAILAVLVAASFIWKIWWVIDLLLVYLLVLGCGIFIYLRSSWRVASMNHRFKSQLRAMTPAERDSVERELVMRADPMVSLETVYSNPQVHRMPGAYSPQVANDAAQAGLRLLRDNEKWRAEIEGREPRPVEEIIARWSEI